jgi:hypothetical protein
MQIGLLKMRRKKLLNHLEVLKSSGIGNNFSTEVDKEETCKQNVRNGFYLPVPISSVLGLTLPNYS